MARVADLIRAHATFEEYGEVPATRDLLGSQLLDEGRAACFVAVVDGLVVGYATAAPEYSTWNVGHYLHMDTLFVHDEHRGHGIGRLLFDEVVRHGTGKGFAQLQWQTPDWNHDAIAFYQRLGAVGANKKRFVLDLGVRSWATAPERSNQIALEEFTTAWDRRDTKEIARLLHPDCCYQASIGPEPGTTHIGRQQVLAGIEKMWLTDGQCDVDLGPIIETDDTIVRTWTYHFPDRSHARGIDVFTFADHLIIGKDAYRKITLPLPTTGSAAVRAQTQPMASTAIGSASILDGDDDTPESALTNNARS